MSLLCWLAALITDWPWLALLVLGTITWLSISDEGGERSRGKNIAIRQYARPSMYLTNGTTPGPEAKWTQEKVWAQLVEATAQRVVAMTSNKNNNPMTRTSRWNPNRTDVLGSHSHTLPSESRPHKGPLAKITIENTAGDVTTLAASRDNETRRAEQACERKLEGKDQQIARLRDEVRRLHNENSLLCFEAEQHEEEVKGKEMIVYNGVRAVEEGVEDLHSRLDKSGNSWHSAPKGASASNRPSTRSSERTFSEDVRERFNDIRDSLGQAHSLTSELKLELTETTKIKDSLRHMISAFLHASDEETTADIAAFESPKIVTHWRDNLPPLAKMKPIIGTFLTGDIAISNPLDSETPVSDYVQATMQTSDLPREHAMSSADATDQSSSDSSGTFVTPRDNTLFDFSCFAPEDPAPADEHFVDIRIPFTHLRGFPSCPPSFLRLEFHEWENMDPAQRLRHIIENGPFVTTLREYAVLVLHKTCSHCGNSNHIAVQDCPVWRTLVEENRCEGCYEVFEELEDATKHHLRNSHDKCRHWDVLELKKGWATWEFHRAAEIEEKDTAQSVISIIEPSRPTHSHPVVTSPDSPGRANPKSRKLQTVVEEVEDYSD